MIAVDWGTSQWVQEGRAGEGAVSLIETQLEEKRRLFGMTSEECLDCLESIVGLRVPRVIVSTRDYAALLAQQSRFTSEYFQQQLRQATDSSGLHPRPDLPTAYVAPGNEVEQLLAGLWQDHFGIEKIGLEDNFFELGGHSLLAVQLLSRLGSTFSIPLTLQDLFDHPTIGSLAALATP